MKNVEIERFYAGQLHKWGVARDNFHALKRVETKKLRVGSSEFTVMFNAGRELSSAAKIDAESIARRRCFLCAENRPAEQEAYPIMDGYSLLVNPFPIFDHHFTIASDTHQPQSILRSEADGSSRISTMFRLAQAMPGFTIFYNGPQCGASAPDHLHFQAIPAESLPAVNEGGPFPYKYFCVEASDITEFTAGVHRCLELLRALPENQGLDEPRVNIFVQQTAGELSDKPHEDPTVSGLIVARRAHRPKCYGSQAGQILISPGAIDVGGAVICCRRQDFEAIDNAILRGILDETTYLLPSEI